MGIFWIAANALIKLSILFFYRRNLVGRIYNVCYRVLMGLSIIWPIFAFFSWILNCGSHVRANFEGGWDVCDYWGSHIQIGVSGWDTFINFCLLVLPISFVSDRFDFRPLMYCQTD